MRKLGIQEHLTHLQQECFLCLYGKATKISKYLINHDKEYVAEIKLGTCTDTLDREGRAIEEREVDKSILDTEKIIKALKQFIGKQTQIPPMYSAIKLNGKKLYEYAREGKQIDIQPRQIEIYDIKFNKVDKENNKLNRVKVRRI